MADVKWIKITVDVFDDEKILLIESMPDSDSLITIWFKLLCLAGKHNNSGVFMLNERIKYTDEMLSTIFRRNVNTVRLALTTFEQFGMIEKVNDVITIPNWDKHQNLDQLENKKQYMKEYMNKRRERQKQLTEGSNTCKTNSKTNSKTNGKTNVSSLEGEGDKEEGDKEEGEVEVDKAKKIPTAATFLKNPITVYQNNIGLITEHIAERMKHLVNDGVCEELICKYIEVATERNKRNWAYVEKMALGNLGENVKTVQDYEAYLVSRKKTIQKQETKKLQHQNFEQREYDEADYDKYYANTED